MVPQRKKKFVKTFRTHIYIYRPNFLLNIIRSLQLSLATHLASKQPQATGLDFRLSRPSLGDLPFYTS